MVNPIHFIYGVVASFVVYTGYTSTERVREAALRSRLTTFYAEHAPPVPSESKIDRLLSKHEYDEAAIDAALQGKYGVTLPPEDLSSLFAEDMVTTAAYAMRRSVAGVSEKAAAAVRSNFPEGVSWATNNLARNRERLFAATHAIGKEFGKHSMPLQLSRIALTASVAHLVAPKVLQLPVAIGALAFVALAAQPGPADLAPAPMLAELSRAWTDGEPAHRLSIGSSALIILRAALGVRHAQPCLALWLLLAACVTSPARDGGYEQMDFVDAAARRPLRSLIASHEKRGEKLLMTHDFGVGSIVTLQGSSGGGGEEKSGGGGEGEAPAPACVAHTACWGRSGNCCPTKEGVMLECCGKPHGWDAPVMAVGALGQWHAVGGIHMHADKKGALEVKQGALPAGVVPGGALLLLLAAYTSAGWRRRHVETLDSVASTALLVLCVGARSLGTAGSVFYGAPWGRK